MRRLVKRRDAFTRAACMSVVRRNVAMTISSARDGCMSAYRFQFSAISSGRASNISYTSRMCVLHLSRTPSTRREPLNCVHVSFVFASGAAARLVCGSKSFKVAVCDVTNGYIAHTFAAHRESGLLRALLYFSLHKEQISRITI